MLFRLPRRPVPCRQVTHGVPLAQLPRPPPELQVHPPLVRLTGAEVVTVEVAHDVPDLHNRPFHQLGYEDGVNAVD